MSEHVETGWCKRGEHDSCHGELKTATGHSWWCACLCHPEPTPTWDTDDSRKALTVWRNARKQLAEDGAR